MIRNISTIIDNSNKHSINIICSFLLIRKKIFFQNIKLMKVIFEERKKMIEFYLDHLKKNE